MGRIQNYANTFKMVREMMGLTLQELADMHDLSRSTICLYESGSRMPKTKVVLWYLENAGELMFTEVDCHNCNGTGLLTICKFREPTNDKKEPKEN